MDIEWTLKSSRKDWAACWESIEVYADELIIFHNDDTDFVEFSSKHLENIFGDSWDSINNVINLQITDRQIQVIFERTEENSNHNRKPLPLFRNAVYQEPNISGLSLQPFSVPVIAFHSYKGGVGRTLSLISLVRESSREGNFRTLIVDADIEALGFTLMAENQGFPSEKKISYTDILSIIHDSDTTALFSSIVKNIAKSMVASTILVPAKDSIHAGQGFYFIRIFIKTRRKSTGRCGNYRPASRSQ
jgi:hypothetical protein